MNAGENKRNQIFNVYSDNLKFLADNKLLNFEVSEPVYICPICFSKFKSIDDADNPLTLEDVPPKSLGGKANILTCKSCNNTCGYKIDFHLTERLRERDSRNFKIGTESKVKIDIADETFQASVKVLENGHLEVVHSEKNNHPIKLNEHMDYLKKGNTVSMEFLKSRVVTENIGYALLKIGYLLSFKMFGYSLLFEECYEPIRKQLLNPDEKIFPERFWFTPPLSKELCGVYFICDEGIESLLAIFELKTEFTEEIYATLLPLPINPIEQVITEFEKRVVDKFELKLYPLEQKTVDYLFNLDNIAAMKSWIKKRQKSK